MSKIAIVHDYFVQMGGAEQVAQTFHDLLPDSPVYTTVMSHEKLSPTLRKARIQVSWMQNLPAIEKYFRHYFLLYPKAVESLDLSSHDLILSSSSGYAKGVRRRPRGAVHVCYCHTPMRWVWRYDDYAAREGFSPARQVILPHLLKYLRGWDLKASQQPDYYIANSQVVADRIKQIYGRESVVIPPPINVDRFRPVDQQEDYYLILSRLVGYKRIDLAVRACTQTNRPLVIIGDGPDRQRLESLAGPGVRFMGRQPDEVVEHYASRCRGLLFPGEEDFGMVPLEINAAGRPVIAYKAGGATETVIDGVTGVFFDQPEVSSVIEAIERFEVLTWDSGKLRQHARGFDQSVFATRLLGFLQNVAPDSCRGELALSAISTP
ncbi:MAG: glycosyltransferase [Blastocatellia bacterium]